MLAPLILGLVLIMAFIVWELYGAKYPMFPRRILQVPGIMIGTLVITFISGANFFSILMFWPTQAFNVYGHDPVGVGIRGIPVGFGILTGAFLALWALSLFRGNNKLILVVSSVLMTAGCGALAIARVDNLHQLWGILIVASLGIGGIVVPASISKFPYHFLSAVYLVSENAPNTQAQLYHRCNLGSKCFCRLYTIIPTRSTSTSKHLTCGILHRALKRFSIRDTSSGRSFVTNKF